MKKLLFLLAVIALFSSACTKYCTCTNPNANPQELEVGYQEDCANYSNSSRNCK